jgi:Uma2 family endonuclease
MVISLPQTGYILRHNLSWQEFEQIAAEREHGSGGTRLAYDRGTLEIIVPLLEHEYFKEVISVLVQDLAEELEIDYESFGSTTWKEEKKLAGVEPDNCFYIQSESLIRSKLPYIDLAVDPPPDLALEVDITSKSLDRQPIYARLGVPELWRYDEGMLKIYQLQGTGYVETQVSLAFPQFPVQEIPQFVAKYQGQGRRALRKAFREWVRHAISASF